MHAVKRELRDLGSVGSPSSHCLSIRPAAGEPMDQMFFPAASLQYCLHFPARNQPLAASWPTGWQIGRLNDDDKLRALKSHDADDLRLCHPVLQMHARLSDVHIPDPYSTDDIDIHLVVRTDLITQNSAVRILRLQQHLCWEQPPSCLNCTSLQQHLNTLTFFLGMDGVILQRFDCGLKPQRTAA